MSYLVLARKYRPRSFEQLVGQEHVVQALSNALTQQRLHHAYLFTGTRGVGKTTVSRILAKSLNCTGADGQGGITATPCDVCEACTDINAGRFVDYVELDAASNRGVDEISQLLDQSVYKPVVGRFKVYMIDEVHMLSTTAFNAMLKTLEEPPDYLKFVLATTDPQKVPATVLSRCLQFNLRPMAPQTVQAHLDQVLQAEGIAAEPGALRALARAAQGSMRDALSLTDQAIAFGAGRVEEAAVRQMLGAVDDGLAVGLLDHLAAGDGAALVASVDRLRAEGQSAAGTLDAIARLLQSVAVVQAAPGALDPTDPQLDEIVRLAGTLAADELQLYYSMALHGRPELELAPDEYSGLVMVLLRMLSFRAGGAPARAAASSPVASVPPASAGPATAVAQGPAVGAAAAVSSPPTAPLLRPTQAIARVPAPVPSVAAPPRHEPRAQPPAPVSRAPAARSTEQELPPWLDAPPEDEAQALDMDAAGWDDARPLGAAVPPEPPTDAPPSAPEVPLSAEQAALGERWGLVVEQVLSRQLVTGLVRELALQAQCLGVDDTTSAWQLQVERDTLRNPSHLERLQVAVRAVLGEATSLQVSLGPVIDSPALREAAAQRRREREAEATIHNDADVQWLLQQFKSARIVPGSIKPIAS